MRRLFWFSFLLLVGGCGEMPPPLYVSPLYVSANLIVGDSVQYVFVDVPRSPEEPRGKGVNDAEVAVSDGDTTYVFQPVFMSVRVLNFDNVFGQVQEDSVWMYVAHFSVEPLKTYRLTVVRGKDVATGTTTTPDTFSVLLVRFDPSDSSITPMLPGDTVRLPQDTTLLAMWLAVKGASYYYTFTYNYDKRDSVTLFKPPRYLFISLPDTNLMPGMPDSVRAAPPFAYYKSPAFEWGSGNYAVKVWALNEDRYRWGVLDEGNLQNAEGFFGAVSQTIVVVPVELQK